MLRSTVATVSRPRCAASPKRLVDEIFRTFLRFRSAATENFTTENIGNAPTIDDADVKRFSTLSKDWWNIDGPLKALHSFNVIRIPWIRDRLRPNYKQEAGESYLPLKQLNVIDVGCGAGIISEPLARLGANVVGIDASEENIKVAIWRRDRQPELRGRIEYLCGSLSDVKQKYSNKFDAVIASEVLEHVTDRVAFVEQCVTVAKSGSGSLFFTTLNQTIASKVLGIWAAENIFRIVPQGIHEWEKFTPPLDLRLMLEKENCRVHAVHGLLYNPLTNRWAWSRCDQINYGLYAVKNS